MSYNPTNHSGWGSTGHDAPTSNSASFFTGKYHSATVVATTQTASFGDSSGGAILLGNGADDAATKIFVAGGGVIAGTDLATETIYELSVSQVQSTGGNIFVFKRQQ